MSRVLVTGATGFVGRQVARALDAQGHEVVAFVRRGSAPPVWSKDVVETQDLFAESPKVLQSTLTSVDAVVHVAWYAEPGKYLNSEKNLDCLTGTIRLARAAMAAGVRKFVGVGTCFEYDLNTSMASDERRIEPDSALRPDTVYGASKAAAYMALDRAFADAGVSFAWCRLFYLFGEGEDSRRLLPYVLERLNAGAEADLTPGTQLRDFLDVREAGRQIANVVAAQCEGPINVCSGEAISVRNFILSQVPDTADKNLLNFGARQMRSDEHPCVVGRPGGLSARGWEAQNA